MLDVYSSPSLFDATEFSQPGFTIINIYGANSPHYASLDYYHTRNCEYFDTKRLVREGRVLTKIIGICTKVSPKQQEEKLVPLLEAAEGALAWAKDHKAKYLFEEVWRNK